MKLTDQTQPCFLGIPLNHDSSKKYFWGRIPNASCSISNEGHNWIGEVNLFHGANVTLAIKDAALSEEDLLKRLTEAFRTSLDALKITHEQLCKEL